MIKNNLASKSFIDQFFYMVPLWQKYLLWYLAFSNVLQLILNEVFIWNTKIKTFQVDIWNNIEVVLSNIFSICSVFYKFEIKHIQVR